MNVESPRDQSGLPSVLRGLEDDRTLQQLLESRIPARLAWVAPDGTPRIAPMWFTWTRERLVISAFAGARKLDALAIGAAVALSIDTEDFPYRSLTVRGVVSDVRPFEGLTPDYVAAAARYLGPSLGQTWCDALQGRAIQTRIAVRPTHAVVADLARDSSFFSRPK